MSCTMLTSSDVILGELDAIGDLLGHFVLRRRRRACPTADSLSMRYAASRRLRSRAARRSSPLDLGGVLLHASFVAELAQALQRHQAIAWARLACSASGVSSALTSASMRSVASRMMPSIFLAEPSGLPRVSPFRLGLWRVFWMKASICAEVALGMRQFQRLGLARLSSVVGDDLSSSTAERPANVLATTATIANTAAQTRPEGTGEFHRAVLAGYGPATRPDVGTGDTARRGSEFARRNCVESRQPGRSRRRGTASSVIVTPTALAKARRVRGYGAAARSGVIYGPRWWNSSMICHASAGESA